MQADDTRGPIHVDSSLTDVTSLPIPSGRTRRRGRAARSQGGRCGFVARENLEAFEEGMMQRAVCKQRLQTTSADNVCKPVEGCVLEP